MTAREAVRCVRRQSETGCSASIHFPSDANYEKLKVHLENYSAALDKFKEELKTEVAPALARLRPMNFSRVYARRRSPTCNRARVEQREAAGQISSRLRRIYHRPAETQLSAPLLGQELSQMQMLINILLDAKVDSVTSFHRDAIAGRTRSLRLLRHRPPVPARTGAQPADRSRRHGWPHEIARAQHCRSHV